jgi:CHAD domain-containing protein
MKPKSITAFAHAQTRSRLKRVLTQVRRAATHPQDPEVIHDLRVSIRRFTQCLRTFRSLFNPRPVKKLKRSLRNLMDLCAAVRSCDVALAVLQQAGVPPGASTSKLGAARAQAEQALRDHLKKERRRKNPDWEKRLQLDVQKGSEVLSKQAKDFFEAGTAAAVAGADYQTLHQFRLLAKRFRYTLELFPSYYGRDMGRGLQALKDLQDRLGMINDCIATIALIRKDDRAVAAVRKLLRQREEEFQSFWQSEFPAEKLAWWQGWLRRPVTVT